MPLPVVYHLLILNQLVATALSMLAWALLGLGQLSFCSPGPATVRVHILTLMLAEVVSRVKGRGVLRMLLQVAEGGQGSLRQTVGRGHVRKGKTVVLTPRAAAVVISAAVLVVSGARQDRMSARAASSASAGRQHMGLGVKG
jgi:hypothetical protein